MKSTIYRPWNSPGSSEEDPGTGGTGRARGRYGRDRRVEDGNGRSPPHCRPLGENSSSCKRDFLPPSFPTNVTSIEEESILKKLRSKSQKASQLEASITYLPPLPQTSPPRPHIVDGSRSDPAPSDTNGGSKARNCSHVCAHTHTHT